MPESISKKWVLAVLVLMGFFCFESAFARAEKMEVFVSILPQAYFVERIGGDRVNVSVLVGPGQSPHTYEPTPRQMADLGRARLFFRIGSPFEQRLIEKIGIIFDELTIVDTRNNVPMLYFSHDHHHAGHDDHHHHGSDPDPHIWLDPKRVKIQALTICEALVEMDHSHAGLYRENLRKFVNELDAIDEKISAALAPLKGGSIYVFHPAFGYFADSYGLRQIAIEIDGKEPSPRQLAAIIEKAKDDGGRVIFVQPQFSRRHAEAMAREIKGAVVPLNPLAPDYLENLEYMTETIRSALEYDSLVVEEH
ncbi:MAG: zinc ABC transporter substrate-binding protein [Syntrophales bacterium]|nr:zinc ABC transporter substrate-binding protein [Syntrophales bacterium]